MTARAIVPCRRLASVRHDGGIHAAEQHAKDAVNHAAATPPIGVMRQTSQTVEW